MGDFGEDFVNVSLPGERGVIGVIVLGKWFERVDSGRGVEYRNSSSEDWSDDTRPSALPKASSNPRILLLLLGVGLVMVCRLDRLFPLKCRFGSTVLALFPGASQRLAVLIVLRSSGTLPLPFLLSLRRSRIPFELRFLTAGLRIRARLTELRRIPKELGPSATAVDEE